MTGDSFTCSLGGAASGKSGNSSTCTIMAMYGRVSSGDKSHIVDEDGCATDEWGVRYQGHSRPDGSGLFTKDLGLKSHCQKLRRRRCILATLIAVGACLLTIFIVVIAESRKSSNVHPPPPRPHFRKWSNSTDGFYFMPSGHDGSVLIELDVNKYPGDGYGSYITFLDYHLLNYQSINQQARSFYPCNKTDAPPDKVCMFDEAILMDCDHFHEYGYTSGTPCVLFFLNPPRDHMPKPYPKDSEVAKRLGDRWSSEHIGVTCSPLTEEDAKHIGNQTLHGPSIEYFPPKGFPTYYFRHRNITAFLPPIVMVRFNTIANFAYVQINCTAWVNNLHNIEYYSKTFGFYIK